MATRKKMPDVMGELLAGSSSGPASQQASKPLYRQTSIPVKQAADTKVKSTYYLSQQNVDALEEAKLKLRRLAPKNKRQISTSAIVDAALQIVISDLEIAGEKSQLASILANQ